jgi:hypothetical protein
MYLGECSYQYEAGNGYKVDEMVQFLGISEEILPESHLAAIQWALTGQIVFFRFESPDWF